MRTTYGNTATSHAVGDTVTLYAKHPITGDRVLLEGKIAEIHGDEVRVRVPFTRPAAPRIVRRASRWTFLQDLNPR